MADLPLFSAVIGNGGNDKGRFPGVRILKIDVCVEVCEEDVGTSTNGSFKSRQAEVVHPQHDIVPIDLFALG
jgi:hypothetical protein